MRSLFITITFVFALGTFDAGAQSKLSLWKVKGKRNTVYLYGSVHIVPASVYPLNGAVYQAFAKSSVLAVEADITQNQMVAVQLVLKKGRYSGGKTIKDDLSAETYGKLVTLLNANGLPVAQMVQFRPWFLSTVLVLRAAMGMGFSATSGIDKHFLEKAQALINSKARPMRIVELESIPYQIKLMADLPKSLQDAMIANTIKQFPTLGATLSKIVRLWKAGDSAGLAGVLFQYYKKPPFTVIYKRIFVDRNHSMTGKIVGYAAQSENHFVVVGAGHMVGSDGIVAQLRKRGFSVTQLSAQ